MLATLPEPGQKTDFKDFIARHFDVPEGGSLLIKQLYNGGDGMRYRVRIFAPKKTNCIIPGIKEVQSFFIKVSSNAEGYVLQDGTNDCKWRDLVVKGD